jgi:hypothetical protein
MPTRLRRLARTVLAPATFLIACALLSRDTHAQVAGTATAQRSRFAGGSLIAAMPLGDYADFAKTSWGATGNLVWPLDLAALSAIRVELGFDTNTRDKSRVCATDPFTGECIPLDFERRDNTLILGVGPQFTLRRGMLQPYVTGTVGVSYLTTTSQVQATYNQQPIDTHTDFDNTSFMWTAGGGFYVPLSAGSTPMLLDIAARYHGINSARYLARNEDADSNSDALPYHEVKTKANSLVLHLGLSFGF